VSRLVGLQITRFIFSAINADAEMRQARTEVPSRNLNPPPRPPADLPLFLPASLLYAIIGRSQGARLIATLRLFRLWALLVAGVQVAPVATAIGDEADVIDLLSTSRIRTAATWCYKKPGPERCGVTLHIKGGRRCRRPITAT
jgi:hypothetical protein